MQSRRHNESMAVSPTPRDHSRNHRYELGPGQFQLSRGNTRAGDRSPPPQSRTGRSSSPQRGLDGSQRGLVVEPRNGSIERRGEFGFHMGGGGRTDKVRSPSPPFDRMQKRPHCDEDIVHRKYALSAHFDSDPNDNIRSKQVYGYGHEMVAQKTMPMEDGEVRESYRLSPDVGPYSNHEERGGHFQLSPRSMNMSLFEHDKLRYLESMPVDKLPVMEHYKPDKPMPSASQFKGFANTSRISRGEAMGVYRDDVPSWHLDDFSSSGKNREPVGLDAYGQRLNIDSDIHPDIRRQNLLSYRHDAFSPTRVEHEDYSLPNSRVSNGNHGYKSGAIHRTMPPDAELDYDCTLIDYDHRDVSRSTVMRPVHERGETTDDSCGNLRKSRMWDHSSQKSTVPDYLDRTRTSNALKERDEYLGSGSTHVEYGRRVSRDHEMLPMATISHNHQTMYMRPDQGFGRDADPRNERERPSEISPRSRYEAEMHGLSVRGHRMQEDELGIYEPVDRVLKRKYRMEDEMRSRDSRSIMSSKWNAHGNCEHLHDYEEEWTGEDMRRSYPSRRVKYDYDDYGEAERTYDGHHQHHIGYASDDLPPSRFSLGHTKRHSIRSYKHANGNRYIKNYTTPGSYGWHNTNHSNRRSVYHRQHKVWKSSDDYHRDHHHDDHVNGGEPSQDWDNAVRSEPPEESEEFLKLVHEAFIMYYKRLNMNPAIRRRYLEQGKAGSLFCIVCGRSVSKEFMDTQSLGKHAFMCHKIGSRAQHLGLLKAICVLLGWNSVVPPGTITWGPQVLPEAEALAQKEDLILWPPLVIIHNISTSNRNSEEQKAVSAERLEAFLRGKGCVGGKIKVCPGDDGIMTVKFLGTFTGLEKAERLHKYFADNKHGRVDFENLDGNKEAGGLQGGDKEEEMVVYGYMGIVDDLDKLDYNTKKICLIESKKGIQDLADAPVKREER